MVPVEGPRARIGQADGRYPSCLRQVRRPPEALYVLGDPAALQEGLAVIGARRATSYGCGCAERFAGLAASAGLTIVSGGARGCDAAAHRAALAAGAPTVVFLGGGCDRLYPAEHRTLFQRIVDKGGALVSEHPWDREPRPWAFRERNRLIAGLARAVLIVEAGLPSGTFSTADEALAAGKQVLVVPGAITSIRSRGSNRLLYDGATPVVDDDSFADQLEVIFGVSARAPVVGALPGDRGPHRMRAGAAGGREVGVVPSRAETGRRPDAESRIVAKGRDALSGPKGIGGPRHAGEPARRAEDAAKGASLSQGSIRPLDALRGASADEREVIECLQAEPLLLERLLALMTERWGDSTRARRAVMGAVVAAEAAGVASRQSDGRWMAVPRAGMR
ncbi:DNA-protecting protein DprA [Eggerthellaceae bacterium zg-1084]|uniref:DNA-protecting protein DprA n=2 Tax=Berryella wangjianweii TaxID=2734634 RepID=A0A6M8J7Y0_9ACTN|nr:DNA-protecting protein DprA [Berryella wangjianweii]QKF07956.1 DNA-protecting protein DprA [Berryella wangjianweii]